MRRALLAGVLTAILVSAGIALGFEIRNTGQENCRFTLEWHGTREVVELAPGEAHEFADADDGFRVEVENGTTGEFAPGTISVMNMMGIEIPRKDRLVMIYRPAGPKPDPRPDQQYDPPSERACFADAAGED